MSNELYQTPKQLAASDRYPFTIGQIRHLLLHRHRNGLEKAVRKIGKRLVVRMDLFDQWIEKQSAGSRDRN